MAGSFNHVINKKTGALSKPDRVLGMLDCYHGDVYEAIEEMYGMIWWLAVSLDEELQAKGPGTPAELVEEARQSYKAGLRLSPTKRFKFPKDIQNKES